MQTGSSGHRRHLPSAYTKTTRGIEDMLRMLGYELAEFSNDEGPGDIGHFIGSDHIWELTTGGSTKISDKLRAVETAVGWTIQGPVQGKNKGPYCMQTVALRTSVMERSTTDILTKFWALELIGINGNEPKTVTNAVVECRDAGATSTRPSLGSVQRLGVEEGLNLRSW